MNNILKVVTDIGGEVHTEPVDSNGDENIDGDGQAVIMIVMAAVMIIEPVSGGVDQTRCQI